MKRALAAIALIGITLLASGCSFPTAYTIRNRTDVEVTVLVTKTPCEEVPGRYDDFVHEGKVAPGALVSNHDGWATDYDVQCLRVLDPQRRVILEERYQVSDGYSNANHYEIRSTLPLSQERFAHRSDFPGPSIWERAMDAAYNLGEYALIFFAIGFSLSIGILVLGILLVFWSLPFVLGYTLIRWVVRFWQGNRSAPDAPA